MNKLMLAFVNAFRDKKPRTLSMCAGMYKEANGRKPKNLQETREMLDALLDEGFVLVLDTLMIETRSDRTQRLVTKPVVHLTVDGQNYIEDNLSGLAEHKKAQKIERKNKLQCQLRKMLPKLTAEHRRMALVFGQCPDGDLTKVSLDNLHRIYRAAKHFSTS